MRFPKTLILGFFLIAWPPSGLLRAETSVASLLEQVRQLSTQLQAIPAREDQKVPGVLAFSAEQAFQSAEQSFREREFVSVVRQLNFVLNQVSQLPQGRYLRSQYLLGRSYEELALPNRAIKAYLRYINSYATQSGDPPQRLIEVIRRTLLLSEYHRTKDQDQLQRLLSNLVSMNFPADVKAEVTLLSSIAAYRHERNRLAADWLKPLLSDDVPLRIRAEASFYAAQNALTLGQEAEAERLLLAVAALPEASLLFIKDLATLNLARLYAAQKMPQKSWEWYQKVEGPGAALRLAAYEAVLLLVQNQDYTRALQLARSYIAHYPQTREAYQLQERLAFLELHAGHLEPAEGQMQARDRALEQLQQGLVTDFRNKSLLGAQDVEQLIDRTEIMAMQSPVLEQSRGLSQELKKIDQTLAEQRQEIRHLIFMVGRIQDPILRPEIIAMDRQYQVFIKQLFAIGEGLLSHEQQFYQQRLTPAHLTRLKRSQARRQMLLESPRELRRGSWRGWNEIAQHQLRLAGLAQRIERQRAELAALRLAAKTARQNDLAEKRDPIEDLVRRSARIEQGVAQQVEAQRLAILTFIRQPSPLQTTRRTLLLGTQEFIDSSSLLEQHRDHFKSPLAQHQQEDIDRAWRLWQREAGRILSWIKRHEAEQAQWLTQQLETIRQQLDAHRQLVIKRDQLVERLSRTTGRALPAVLDHFDFHIQEQRARSKKWLADLQWQRYVTQTEEKLRLKSASDDQEATIQENLKDLELRRSLHD